MDGWQRALRLMPPALRPAAQEAACGRCEQLRLRLGQPVVVSEDGREKQTAGPSVTREDLRFVLEQASRASFQTAEDPLRCGYITAEGGIRVGVCGTAVLRDGRSCGLRQLSSLCIRVPQERRGCADELFGQLYEGEFLSTLICSAPGAGKTTLLREIVRRLSDGGCAVAVADERGEIAGGMEEAAFSLGAHTDVMTAMPKAQAVLQLVRTMCPQVVAMDEITDAADAAALTSAAGCGTALLATVHAAGVAELDVRPVLRRLIGSGAFRRAVVIRRRGAQRVYEVTAL